MYILEIKCSYDVGLKMTEINIPKSVKEIIQLHVENGGSVIFSTHILEVAEEVCDRICIVNKGKAVATGTMEELSKPADKAGGQTYPGQGLFPAKRLYPHIIRY